MDLIDLLTRWDVFLVFGSVLLEQGGLPVPAAPILVSAGALAAGGSMRPEHVLATAVVACLLADIGWFIAGRKIGRRVLAGLCRFSLSPDTCVRTTDDLISRRGQLALLVAKFIPGVSAVAIPTAAAMGLGWRRFLLFDTLGCLIWAGTYIGAGMIFSRQVNRLLEMISTIGGWSIAFAALLLAVYIGIKFIHRRRLQNLHRLVRIAPSEVSALIDRGDNLLILDARSALARDEDPRVLPGAMFVDALDPLANLPEDAAKRTLVTFCTCPNEASAAIIADRLIKAGYRQVRVLTGGNDALEALSHPRDPRLLASVQSTT